MGKKKPCKPKPKFSDMELAFMSAARLAPDEVCRAPFGPGLIRLAALDWVSRKANSAQIFCPVHIK